MKIPSVLVLLFFCCGMLKAQQVGSIKGSVIGTDGNIPFDAIISVEKAGQTQRTNLNSSGWFHMTGLEQGTYNVKISAMEYQDIEITGVEVDTDKITWLRDIEMVFDNNLDPIIVKAPVVLINPEDTGLNTVSKGVMQDMGTPRQLAKSATLLVPGLDKSPDNELYFKGARSGANAFYLDGVRVDAVPSVPGFAVAKFNVYTGGVPARYGDVTGGVMAVETKSYFDLYQEWQNAQL